MYLLYEKHPFKKKPSNFRQRLVLSYNYSCFSFISNASSQLSVIVLPHIVKNEQICRKVASAAQQIADQIKPRKSFIYRL